MSRLPFVDSGQEAATDKAFLGYFFPGLTGWANFWHASGVGPGLHRR